MSRYTGETGVDDLGKWVRNVDGGVIINFVASIVAAFGLFLFRKTEPYLRWYTFDNTQDFLDYTDDF